MSQELDFASAERIKEADGLKDSVVEDLGVGEECNFNELLYVCNSQFRERSDTGNTIYKAFIFTIHDVPNVNQPDVHQSAIEYAKVS